MLDRRRRRASTHDGSQDSHTELRRGSLSSPQRKSVVHVMLCLSARRQSAQRGLSRSYGDESAGPLPVAEITPSLDEPLRLVCFFPHPRLRRCPRPAACSPTRRRRRNRRRRCRRRRRRRRRSSCGPCRAGAGADGMDAINTKLDLVVGLNSKVEVLSDLVVDDLKRVPRLRGNSAS